MQSDFATIFKRAVSEAQVPAVPLAAIRSAANTRTPYRSSRRRPAAFYVFALALLSGITAAFGAQIWEKVHITLVPGGITSVEAQNVKTFWEPDALQLRSVLSRASYRVIVPSGLPAKARLVNLVSSGHDVFLFDFSWPQGAGKKHSGIAMIVANPKMLDLKQKAAGRSFWTVHGEEVLLTLNSLSARQIAAIRKSMEVHPCTLRSISDREAQILGRVLQGCSYELRPIKSMHAPRASQLRASTRYQSLSTMEVRLENHSLETPNGHCGGSCAAADRCIRTSAIAGHARRTQIQCMAHGL